LGENCKNFGQFSILCLIWQPILQLVLLIEATAAAGLASSFFSTYSQLLLLIEATATGLGVSCCCQLTSAAACTNFCSASLIAAPDCPSNRLTALVARSRMLSISSLPFGSSTLRSGFAASWVRPVCWLMLCAWWSLTLYSITLRPCTTSDHRFAKLQMILQVKAPPGD